MKQSSSSSSSFEYEFGGPIGTGLTMLLLPIIVLLLAYWSDVGEIRFPSSLAANIFFPGIRDGQVWSCVVVLILYMIYHMFLERFLPGPLVAGVPITELDGRRLVYRINGHLSFWITLLIAHTGWPSIIHTNDGRSLFQFIAFPHWSYLYDHFAALAFASIILTTIFSCYLYLSSFWPPPNNNNNNANNNNNNNNHKVLAKGGNSGNVVYDFWMGRELNPRIFDGTFDWKQFCELRPGLIGWMVLNLSCMVRQREHLGYNTGSMILINIVQGVYVWDALYAESAILTTMDITTDGFGFMLCFGDLAWVPFTYSLQARYLVYHDPHLPYHQLSIIVCIYLLGYWIFRRSNGQKDLFRRDPGHPDVAHLSYLPTKRGTKLLTSGWFGMARKINYLGDYIMAVSWCLLCGCDSLVPYYYSIYFAILLYHRSIRDDHICAEKYGPDWNEYKKIVPYRFIPGIV